MLLSPRHPFWPRHLMSASQLQSPRSPQSPSPSLILSGAGRGCRAVLAGEHEPCARDGSLIRAGKVTSRMSHPLPALPAPSFVFWPYIIFLFPPPPPFLPPPWTGGVMQVPSPNCSRCPPRRQPRRAAAPTTASAAPRAPPAPPAAWPDPLGPPLGHHPTATTGSASIKAFFYPKPQAEPGGGRGPTLSPGPPLLIQ